MRVERPDEAMPEVLVITPDRHEDERGFLEEVFRSDTFRRSTGVSFDVVQENHSRSEAGVLRGLHFQRPPSAQAKLVRVARGRIFDVAVDLRSGSATFGRWVGRTLDDRIGAQLFVPRGFAHGFYVLDGPADVYYLLDTAYAPGAEGGVRWDDPELGIRWPGSAEPRVSEKDRQLPLLRDVGRPFAVRG